MRYPQNWLLCSRVNTGTIVIFFFKPISARTSVYKKELLIFRQIEYRLKLRCTYTNLKIVIRKFYFLINLRFIVHLFYFYLMKKLLLIRHSRAEKEVNGKDKERPLKYTGMQDAAFMAEKLKEKSLVPPVIITSPALRAKTTAEIFSEHFKQPDAEVNKAIYEASEETLIKVISQLPEEHDFIALIGHNPGVSQVIYYLTGEAKEVHTTTTAIIELNIDKWASVSANSGTLAFFSWPGE